jgi:hypothetical protein
MLGGLPVVMKIMKVTIEMPQEIEAQFAAAERLGLDG